MFPQPTNLIPLHMAKACSPLVAKKQAKNRVPEINGMEGDCAVAATSMDERLGEFTSNVAQPFGHDFAHTSNEKS